MKAKKERTRKLVLLFLLFSVPLYAGLEIPICTSPGDHEYPVIYGDKIVWQDNRNGNWDIYMYDLTKQKEIVICDKPGDQVEPAIYKDKIIWADFRDGNWEIYMYDLGRNEETRITTTGESEYYPAIYENRIVWEVLGGNYDIYVYDISTKVKEKINSAHAESPFLSIWGDKVVWMDWRYGDPDVSKNPYIFIYDIAKKEESHIWEGDKWAPTIYEDEIVFIDGRKGNGDVYLYDLKTQSYTPICENPAPQFRPVIFKDKVVWVDYRNSPSEEPYSNPDIYMYDLKIRKESIICYNSASQDYPKIYENKIVWQDARAGKWDIYMFVLSYPSSFKKSVDKTSAIVGEKLTYSITLKNSESEALQNILVTDVIPSGAEYVEGSATGNVTFDPQAKELSWQIASIGGNSEVIISYSVIAKKEGPISNQAVITCGGVSLATNTVSTTVRAPKLFITKAVNTTNAKQNDRLTYTITYRNEENNALQNITITDVLAPNITYIENTATEDPSYDVQNRTLTWQISSLASGEQKSVSFSASVIGGEEVSNKATLKWQDFSLESNTAITSITIPTLNMTEDVNFSFAAGLFAGIYLEEGISVSSFGLKGAEVAVGAIEGEEMAFSISQIDNDYALKIGKNHTTGAKIEGSLGKAKASVFEATALKGGNTVNILTGTDFLYPNPLADRAQAASAINLILTSAGTFSFTMLPEVGMFVDSLTSYFSPSDQYKTETSAALELIGQMGLLSVDIVQEEGGTKSQISNDVAGAYMAGKMELVNNLTPSPDWFQQVSLTLTTGGSLGFPFVLGKSGQVEFNLGWRRDANRNPLSYFYGASVDEGTNIAFNQLHTLYSYQAEFPQQLYQRIYHQFQDNPIGFFYSATSEQRTPLSPRSLVESAIPFENVIARYAQKGEATYTRSEEQAIQTNLGISMDIGASIGVGGGVRIGFSGEIIYSNSYPVEQGELINNGRVAIKKFARVQSLYTGVEGIGNYFYQMVNNVLNCSDFVNDLKNAFQTITQTIQEAAETAAEYITGGIQTIVNGVSDFFKSGKQASPQIELIGYEIKMPIFRANSRGEYSTAFVPYRCSKVFLISRQPAQEFTAMKYAVNLNIKKANGTYMSSFPEGSVTLKITVGDDQLRERGFDPSNEDDLNSLNIFWFNYDDNSWYQLNTTKVRNSSSILLTASPDKPGTYAAGIASLPPDREAPKIIVLSPQEGAKTSLTPILSAIISDDNLKNSTIKFSIDGVEVKPVYSYVGTEANQYLAIPMQELSSGIHRLDIQAKDESNNEAKVSLNFTASPPQPKQVINFASLPFIPTSPLSQILEFEQTALWTRTSYDMSSDPILQVSQGFWLKTAQPFDASKSKLLGYTPSAKQDISIPLKKGWNPIGLPWNYQVNISALAVEKNGAKVQFSDAGNLVGVILFRWDDTKKDYVKAGCLSGFENTLYPWFGYWIRVKEDCNLVFPKEPWKFNSKKASPSDGFCLPIKAIFPDGSSEEVYVGIGKQEISSLFPPSAPYTGNQRRLSILNNGGALCVDIRKEGKRQEWRLAINGNATLLFPNLSYLLKGWQAILRDGEKRYYLKTTSAVKIEGDKELSLEIGEGLITPLLISQLDARSVRGGINIIWNVNLDCDVKVVIKSPNGLLIRSLGMRSSSAGVNSIFWDGCNQDGRTLPAGIYIIELTARDDMNQMVKAIRMVNLR
jgi:uncharacterized repeat protein (TIGR01451 family)